MKYVPVNLSLITIVYYVDARVQGPSISISKIQGIHKGIIPNTFSVLNYSYKCQIVHCTFVSVYIVHLYIVHVYLIIRDHVLSSKRFMYVHVFS